MTSLFLPLENNGTWQEPEFVAVVLAATHGARLFPMTDTQPKHLLPAAGLPLLRRLLTALADFPQVFIAIADDDQSTIPTLFEGNEEWERVLTGMGGISTATLSSTNALAGGGTSETTAAATTTTTTTIATTAHTTTTPMTTATPPTSSSPTPSDTTCYTYKPRKTVSSSPSWNADVLPKKVMIVRMPEDCPGSAQVLRQLEGVLPIRAHTLVLPGDLLVTQASTLASFLQAHREGQQIGHYRSNDPSQTKSSHCTGAAACTVLLQDVGEQDEQGVPLKESAKAKKGGLARDAEEIEYMALAFERNPTKTNSSNGTTKSHNSHAMTARFIWKQSKLDAEQDEDFTGQTPKLQLPKARFRPSGVVKVRNDWNDLHAYILAPWVVQLVQAKSRIVSLQRDLLPLLIRRQFLGKVESFGQSVDTHRILRALEDSSATNTAANTLALADMGGGPTSTSANSALTPKDANHGTNNGTGSPAAMRPKQTYSVLAHVGTGVMRNFSLPAYLHATKDLLHKLVDPAKQRQQPHLLSLPANAKTNPKLVSLLMADAQIGEKPTLKTSVVGRGCKLGHKCRLNNVILMDEVTLGDNVMLQNTIVGKGAVIGDNCSLNDCQVAAGKHVESGTKEKGEVLVDAIILE